MAGKWPIFRRTLQRQTFEPNQLEESPLRRCLNYWDVTALGLGSSLGAGTFVLLGAVAVQVAGPSVVLSFLIAGLAALMAGLCYAEFGARVPRAGSAYTYAYVTVGEFLAFIVGWNNILESVFATASLARGMSMFVDEAANNSMSEWFTSSMPISVSYLSPYFDLLAFLLVIALGALLCSGARASCAVSGALAALNVATVVFVICAGAAAANPENWRIPAEQVPDGQGAGGWLPHGAWGALRGAAICFYGFAGFDSISATAEEVKKPRQAIPFAILTVFGVAFLAYTGVAIVVTMMVPYYQQDAVSAVVGAFSIIGWEWARWIVTIGAIFGISASMLGAMFPLPRLLYCMASDGLFFSCFKHVTSWQTPVVATIIPTAVVATLASILELEQLILMMCVGTLLSYTVVAVCVILLRYRSKSVSECTQSTMKQIVGRGDKSATQASSFIVQIVLLLFVCSSVASALVWRHAGGRAAPLGVVNVAALLLLLIITLQPKAAVDSPFATPLVPLVPLLSIYTNIHLMVFISFQTWIRVIIWILIGIPFYILFVCCCKRQKGKKLEENVKEFSHANKNGKAPIQIVVESPTPPGTIHRTCCSTEDAARAENADSIEMQEKVSQNEIVLYETEKVMVQHAAIIENNEEKEAKIIDMLDKVLQAEEDSYGEIISLKDLKDDIDETLSETLNHRKSFSDLSDAGSDVSVGNQALSKYDVVAQVHREDLPRVSEEKPDRGEADILENNEENEGIDVEVDNECNDSDTNSQTDESGYSDTIDKVLLNDSSEDIKEAPYIPTPPPFDENFFASPNFQKSYTVPKRPSKNKLYEPLEEPEENKPRESVQSNGSQSEDNIVFGSDRQIHFMSKLNNIFQGKIATTPDDGKEKRRRSNSTGNVAENTESAVNRDRPLFLDLKNEILAAQKLRPVNTNTEEQGHAEVRVENDKEEDEDISMSRTDLKSKLESIFANGGPQLLKPRLMKSNPPTPEEAYPTDTSSTESIAKLPKMDKNDTLKRQKDRFGAVLNSFRLSFNKDDEV